MGNLSNHFGEDASLEPAVTSIIKKYYVANAANPGRWGGAFMRGLNKDSAPLRITDTPYWKRKHGEVPRRIWKDPRVKSKSNCLACHRGAGVGGHSDGD